MSNEFFISKCCRAEAQIVFSDFPDFVGEDPKKQSVGTASFKCSRCGKPCDIVPLEEIISSSTSGSFFWPLTISRISNGYILKGQNSETGTPMKSVIEDDDKDELKSHESLLWAVMEYFNFGGSKHDKERLQIVRKRRK